jgi:hypothetical protein
MTLNWPQVLFVASGLIPLIALVQKPADTTLLIYTCFVLAWLARAPLSRVVERAPGPRWGKVLGLFLAAGGLTELCAWGTNYLKAAPEPALFHPQLLVDLWLGSGFYGGWAMAWLLAGRWFRYSLGEAFVVTGLQGIFFEQLGAVFFAMLRTAPANPLLALLLGLYVFAVHGSAVGLALVPTASHFDSPAKRRHWVRFPVVIGLMVGLAIVGTWLAAVAWLPFGGLPSKRSIVEHPLW